MTIYKQPHLCLVVLVVVAIAPPAWAQVPATTARANATAPVPAENAIIFPSANLFSAVRMVVTNPADGTMVTPLTDTQLRASRVPVNSWLLDGTGNAVTSSAEGSFRPLHIAFVDPGTDALSTLNLDYNVNVAAPTNPAGPTLNCERDDVLGSPGTEIETEWTNCRASATGALWFSLDTADVPHYRTSTGVTEDEHQIKATAGIYYGFIATNTNAAARYLRCYNLTAANTTPGTSTVYFGLAIPGNTGGSGAAPFVPVGFPFSTALTCALTTGAADTDTQEVAANEIKIIHVFK